MTRHAKLINTGDSQQVQLPADFRFEGEEVEISRNDDSGVVTIAPVRRITSWDEFFRLRDQIPPAELAGFMVDREHGVPDRDDPFE